MYNLQLSSSNFLDSLPSSQPIAMPVLTKKSKTKKTLILLLRLVSLIIFLILSGILFSTRILSKTPYVVLTPKALPEGFTREKIIKSERDSMGRFYIFTYTNPSRGKFTYHVRFSSPQNIKCTPPESTSPFITGDSEFRPIQSDMGCAMTMVDNDGNKTSLYKWQREDAHFSIFVTNFSIDRKEALDLANSLKFELIFVGKYTENTQ